MPELFDLQCFISRSSKVKGEGRIQLPAAGRHFDFQIFHHYLLPPNSFPIVPHSNYGSICYRLPTFAADRQTDRWKAKHTIGQHKLANK